MTSIILTVIIPAYNAANWIGATLGSLLAQTYPCWEAIVIDDGSTDATRHVVEAMAGADQRITLHCKPNGGTASALNYGIEVFLNRVNRDYLLWLSADDLYPPNALADHYHALMKSDVKGPYFHCSGHYYVTEGDFGIIRLGDIRHPLFNSDFKPDNFFKLQTAYFLFVENYVHGLSFVMNRATISKVGNFRADYPYAHDMDYWIRCSFVTKINFVNARTCIYRLHSGQTSATNYKALCWDPARVVSDFSQTFKFQDFFREIDFSSLEDLRLIINLFMRYIDKGPINSTPIICYDLVDNFGLFIRGNRIAQQVYAEFVQSLNFSQLENSRLKIYLERLNAWLRMDFDQGIDRETYLNRLESFNLKLAAIDLSSTDSHSQFSLIQNTRSSIDFYLSKLADRVS